MGLEVALLNKLLAAMRALVALVILVEALVGFQISKLTEAFSTIKAEKGLFASVHAHVCFEVADLVECLFTCWTTVCFAVFCFAVGSLTFFRVERDKASLERNPVAGGIGSKVGRVDQHVIELENMRPTHLRWRQRSHSNDWRKDKGAIIFLVSDEPQIMPDQRHSRLVDLIHFLVGFVFQRSVWREREKRA